MLKRLAAAATLLALAVPPSFDAADAQHLMTSRQLWKMSKKEAAEQSLADLEAILTPTGTYPKGFEGILFRGGVGGTAFLTRTYGTDYPGICARDVLTLRYAHATAGSEARSKVDEPVRPYHVTVTQQYAFVRQPTVEMLDGSETGYGSQFRRECTRVAQAATWFEISGNDPQLAASAWLLFQEALQGMRAGTLKPEKCETMDEGQERSCMQVLDTLADYHLLHGASDDVLDGAHRYSLTIGDYYVTISTRLNQSSRDAIEGHGVTGIAVEPRSFAVD